MINGAFESYLHARRKGEASAISATGKLVKLPPKRVDPAPVVYFQDIFNIDAVRYIGDELANELCAAFAANPVMPEPPFPECYYQFLSGGWFIFHHLKRVEAGLEVRQWSLRPDYSWRLAAFNFICQDLKFAVIGPAHLNGLAFEDQVRVKDAFVQRMDKYILSTLLLNHRQAKQSDKDNTVDEGETKRSGYRLPRSPISEIPPIYIDIERKETATGATTGTGSPKSPHDRRGHIRTLKSGKEIWISPLKIHGGSQGFREYELK